MTELCQLWGVDKTRTTLYHPQANGMVERNNKGLGDSLRAMLLGRSGTYCCLNCCEHTEAPLTPPPERLLT